MHSTLGSWRQVDGISFAKRKWAEEGFRTRKFAVPAQHYQSFPIGARVTWEVRRGQRLERTAGMTRANGDRRVVRVQNLAHGPPTVIDAYRWSSRGGNGGLRGGWQSDEGRSSTGEERGVQGKSGSRDTYSMPHERKRAESWCRQGL